MKRCCLLIGFVWCCICISVTTKAASVTYMISSRTAVRADGNEPVGAYAFYEQSATTGKIGQMTAGNYVSLNLYGYGGLRIRRVVVEMRSNNAAGAGTLNMQSGDSCVWSIEPSTFASDCWNGAYSTNFVPIEHVFAPRLRVQSGEVLRIDIDALVSSLYVSSFTIDYIEDQEETYTVTLSTGTSVSLPEITEEATGAGVVLPDWAYTDSVWHFVGWAETCTELTETAPVFYHAGERYYPDCHTTLYALYADADYFSNGIVQDTLFASGTYFVADAMWQCVASGGLNGNGRLPTVPLPMQDKNADGLYLLPAMEITHAWLYDINFLPDSMATIRNVLTDSYITWSTTDSERLQQAERAWNWHKMPNGTVLFYHAYTNRTRELRVVCGQSLETADSLWLVNSMAHSDTDGNVLFRVDADWQPKTIRYTSYPQGKTDTDSPINLKVEIIGNYVYNRTQERLWLYKLSGALLLYTMQDIDMSGLPSGIYLLCTDDACRKVFVR